MRQEPLPWPRAPSPVKPLLECLSCHDLVPASSRSHLPLLGHLRPPRKPFLPPSELCSGLQAFSDALQAAFNLFTGHGLGNRQGEEAGFFPT